MELVFFYLFAAGIVGASLLMVTRANVIHAALSLVLAFLFMAGLFVLAGAEFLAGVQILIYAGGIMVLYLFSIMLMNVGVAVRLRQWHRQSALALAAALLLAAEVWVVLERGGYPAAQAWSWRLGQTPGNVEALGQVLYTKFLFPFEVASVLLLAAMIGAIVLAKRQITR
ncbi:MAG: NADH-quinone oxidoreductase subunit J [Candidatus Tectomicrobia bacterium]|nr:NADH-quinone oxidoreductase subunit J [Candidatus Tectomicrobia bacterium]